MAGSRFSFRDFALIIASFVLFLCANKLFEYNSILPKHAIGSISQQDATATTPLVPSSRDDRSSSATIGMFIPPGKAVAMPSVQITEEDEKKIGRGIYGGKGDKPHLGGFTSFDPMGVSPSLWKHMITNIGVKSLLDVGCGKGVSTSWFVLHGLEFVQCVEGSHDAVSHTIVPNITDTDERVTVVEHDFSRGPWWPDRTVDAAWAVEFTEHVGRNYQPNYMTAFRKAALVFVTHSNWGGWHHVEVHDDDWWRVRWEAAGFVYSEHLTKTARGLAGRDTQLKNLTLEMKQTDKGHSVAQHLRTSLQVFINPMVASLPDHAHLFAEHGCYGGKNNGQKIHTDCSEEKAKGKLVTSLPDTFKPLKLTDEMDKQWFDLIKDFTM